MTGDFQDSGKAVIEDGAIVIRVQIAALQTIMDGGFSCGAYPERSKVTNSEGFAKEIAAELNDEDEDGSTMIHKMFDKAINQAIEQGAQNAERHEIQEF